MTSRASLMARLVEIVTGFGAVVDVPELLDRITADAVDLLSAYAVAVAIRDGDKLTLIAGTGPRPELVGRSFPLAGSAVEELLRTGGRSLSAEGARFPHLNEELFRGGPPKRITVALTRADATAAGAVYVVRDEPLTTDEVEALELLAAHAGSALRTAEVFASERELEAAKDLFLATASHELRTPLTVLRGFAETLLNHWDALDDLARRELVATILARTTGMTGLVEQLLLGSRAGIGVTVQLRPFDVAAAVRTAAAAIAGSSADHPLHVDAPGPVMALGDEATIDPVLGQLVENAIKYSPGAGPVEVSVRADGDDAVIRVLDRGVGIAEADLERVFERFARAAAVPREGRAVGGAGLGLYIVKRYVQAQHGSVLAARREGGGTVMEVRLPAC
jgi:signal transduction histidine kinase